jgi:hypothetical protein
MVALSVIIIALTARWAATSVTARVRFQPCGYRIVRPNRNPAVVIGNGFGIGVLGGLSVVMLAIAVLG